MKRNKEQTTTTVTTVKSAPAFQGSTHATKNRKRHEKTRRKERGLAQDRGAAPEPHLNSKRGNDEGRRKAITLAKKMPELSTCFIVLKCICGSPSLLDGSRHEFLPNGNNPKKQRPKGAVKTTIEVWSNIRRITLTLCDFVLQKKKKDSRIRSEKTDPQA